MRHYAEAIIGLGGEGVMLREPSSLYENGRSHSVLKFKVSSIIIAHLKSSVGNERW